MKAMASVEFMTVKEARGYLGVSKQTMARLIKERAIEVYTDLTDKRLKLLRRTDLDRLREPRPLRPASPEGPA